MRIQDNINDPKIMKNFLIKKEKLDKLNFNKIKNSVNQKISYSEKAKQTNNKETKIEKKIVATYITKKSSILSILKIPINQ